MRKRSVFYCYFCVALKLIVFRALFADSDDEEIGFVGDLNDLDGEEDDE